ncbi:MAG: DUF5647 family protein [bacterium]
MKEQEVIQRDIGLTFDFLRYLIDNPQIVDEIPDGAELIFLCNEFPLKIDATHATQLKQGEKIIFNCRHIFEPVRLVTEE